MLFFQPTLTPPKTSNVRHKIYQKYKPFNVSILDLKEHKKNFTDKRNDSASAVYQTKGTAWEIQQLD